MGIPDLMNINAMSTRYEVREYMRAHILSELQTARRLHPVKQGERLLVGSFIADFLGPIQEYQATKFSLVLGIELEMYYDPKLGHFEYVIEGVGLHVPLNMNELQKRIRSERQIQDDDRIRKLALPIFAAIIGAEQHRNVGYAEGYDPYKDQLDKAFEAARAFDKYIPEVFDDKS